MTYYSSTSIQPFSPAILVAPILKIKTIQVGSKHVTPVSSSESTINLKMITDSAGSLTPKTVEDELDREIAAMTPEERLAVILSMAGSWADRDDIVIKDGHINLDEWGFEDLTDLYDSDLSF